MASKSDENAKTEARKGRLAAELRANLLKRKNQARQRKSPDKNAALAEQAKKD
jgi:hypothetical protein